jgi:hypothetical protein
MSFLSLNKKVQCKQICQEFGCNLKSLSHEDIELYRFEQDIRLCIDIIYVGFGIVLQKLH